MKTFTFYRWVSENGAMVYREFTFLAASWTAARKMMSDAMKALA
jgi:hypothetical protein